MARRVRVEAVGETEGEVSMSLTQLLRWNIGAVTVMLVLTIAAGGAATAQELYGSVVGTVQDGSGARIPGATIEIVNRATNLVLTAVVERDRRVHVDERAAGHLRRARSRSRASRNSSNAESRSRAGSISRVDARLEVGALTESVTVQSEARPLEDGQGRHRLGVHRQGSRGSPAARVPQLSEPARLRAGLHAIGAFRTRRSTRPREL